MKKFLAFMLALMMITSLACVPVSAEDVQPAADQTEEVVVEPDVGVPIELPPETTIEFIPGPVVGPDSETDTDETVPVVPKAEESPQFPVESPVGTDGCVDEEALDNYDNDGDGEIDEDVRDSRSIVLVKKRPTNYQELKDLGQDPTTYDLTKAQLDSLSVLEKYNIIDIDMDGKTTKDDLDEWEFIYRDPNERDEKKNHRLKFTTTINFMYAEGGMFPENQDEKTVEKINSLIEKKELIRKDNDINNIKYDWRKRAEMVGGCWTNYDDEKFLKWFEGRIVK